MNPEQRLALNFPSLVIRRPLSFVVGAMAVVVILAVLFVFVIQAFALRRLRAGTS